MRCVDKRFFWAACLLLLAGKLQADIAIHGETVFPVSGDPIEDGVVLVADGRIQAIGPASEVEVPDGYERHEAAVVTPGLIDARSVVGLAGMYNVPADQDQLDTTAPIQAGLRALDAYNVDEGLVEWLRSLGVTTLHTGPAPGALVSGQTMLVRTSGNTVQDASIRDVAGVSMTLGAGIARHFESPGTRSKGVAMIRQAFEDARAYGRQDPDERSTDLGKQALLDALNGDLPVFIHANTATDIITALRLAEEFDLELVLEGAADVYRVLDRVKAADVPVLLHPTMTRAGGESRNAAFDTAARLQEAGIPFAIQGGYEAYVPKARSVLFEAAIAAANGLGRDNALAAITLGPARILDMDDERGSLETGKRADIVLFDGDPFEYASRVCKVFNGGELVSEECL
ncbi:imidazolonepropionase-like amidohydrolase [Natronospira proteinivora]|uniref:Imidazolonepropionase-like amidohydrolase n=1 Tax=Natronospira proteinivora TaxID=1807133 RepID=A0ABT1G969_9GAMM|nr:amidohydrolase family protein [Natronospira proteinivora]MCP1727786.1 imidazolonepropionase-like amidohydrolase [Natronospira proteinivora]